MKQELKILFETELSAIFLNTTALKLLSHAVNIETVYTALNSDLGKVIVLP